MGIPKVAQTAAPYRRRIVRFPSARAAFQRVLERIGPGKRVLLPAYIGWSAREGSGVYDPIASVGVIPVFYRVDSALHIDLDDFEHQLAGGAAAVVMIHYFGHVDPRYHEVVLLARAAGAIVVEDEAHAMFSDLFGGVCGRLGDVCLYSLHKLLPTSIGGALVINPGSRMVFEDSELRDDAEISSPWDFDLLPMARARRRNAALLAKLVAPLVERGVEPLWPLVPDEVPQTFAVKIRASVSRDVLYERMNAAGFGVVSLYHTMISAIGSSEFPVSHELARTVMNLPVHQEATEDELRALVDELARQLG